MSFQDYSIPASFKAYVKSMFKDLINGLVTTGTLTQPQANAAFNVIDTKYA